jgi:hypothetical protein
LNLYGYAGGDPVNFSDPFGLLSCPEEAGGDGKTESYEDCPEGSSGWYANRVAKGEGNQFLNELGGVLATCGESFGCMATLFVAGPIGNAATRIGTALWTARTSTGLATVEVASAAEARIAGRLWTLGGRTIRSGHGTGSVIGRISSDMTRVYRSPVLKSSGPHAGQVAANLERWIVQGGSRTQISNLHLVVP